MRTSDYDKGQLNSEWIYDAIVSPKIPTNNFFSIWTLQEKVKKAFCYQKLIWPFTVWINCSKGQLNSEWIYKVIVSPKMPTKIFLDFCHGSLLKGRAEIWKNFGWHFGRNDDLINSFWIQLTFIKIKIVGWNFGRNDGIINSFWI